MRSHRHPSLALAAGLAAAAALTSACSGFPERGSVTPGRRLESSGPSQGLVAAPPADGADPAAIVRGFLQAGFDFHQDHRIAREYVSSGATQWQAEAPVVVLDNGSLDVAQLPSPGVPSGQACPAQPASASSSPSARPRPPGDGEIAQVCVSGRQLARVDDAGLMHLASPNGSAGDTPAFSRVFTLEAEHGQWRIMTPPEGLILSWVEFEDTYRALPLYFPDSSTRWLVPDIRWFPILTTGDVPPTATPEIATLEVSALLRGAAGWLAPALYPTVPRGTSLTPVGSVQLDGGTARIDLNHRVRNATSRQRLLLRAQLLATLQALSEQGLGTVSDVVLTAEQAELYVPDAEAPVPWTPPSVAGLPKFGRDDAVSFGQSSPLCLTDKNLVGQLGRTPKGQPTCSQRDDLAALAKPGLALATGDTAGKVFAGLVSDRRRVVAMTPGGPAATVLTGAALTAPSIDDRGWIWSSPATSPGWVLAGGIGRRQQLVAVPWLRGRQVLTLRLSPEGDRALLLVRTDGPTRGAAPTYEVIIAGVTRNASGRPVRLSGPGLAVLPDLTSAVDAAWSATDQVVVLGARPSQPGGMYAWRVPVGGEAAPLLDRPLPRTAAGLAVGIGDLLDVFVRTGDGKAVVSSLGSWQPVPVKGLTLPT